MTMPESRVYQDDTVTVSAAAQYAHVSRPTIYARINRGELPAFRIGSSRLRIRLSDLDALYRPHPVTGDAAADRLAG